MESMSTVFTLAENRLKSEFPHNSLRLGSSKN